MNFMEAVKIRCLGKTVMDTDKKYKLEGTGNNIEIYDMEVNDFKKLNKYIVQLDWITVEEKTPLSDKIIRGGSMYEDSIQITDVKEAIKEFIEWCIHNPHHVKLPSIDVFKAKAKETFGDKLT